MPEDLPPAEDTAKVTRRAGRSIGTMDRPGAWAPSAQGNRGTITNTLADATNLTGRITRRISA